MLEVQKHFSSFFLAGSHTLMFGNLRIFLFFFFEAYGIVLDLTSGTAGTPSLAADMLY
jgi:hypothetical protein